MSAETLAYLALPGTMAAESTRRIVSELEGFEPRASWCPTSSIERVYLAGCAHRALRSGRQYHLLPFLDHPDHRVRRLGLEVRDRIGADPPRQLSGVPLWSPFPARTVEREDGSTVSRSPIDAIGLSASWESSPPKAVRELAWMTARGDGTVATEWGAAPHPTREFSMVYRAPGTAAGDPPADLTLTVRRDVGPGSLASGGGLRWSVVWEAVTPDRERIVELEFADRHFDAHGALVHDPRIEEYERRPDLFGVSQLLIHEVAHDLARLAVHGVPSTGSAALALHPDPVIAGFAVRTHQLWGAVWPLVSHRESIDYRERSAPVSRVPLAHRAIFFDPVELPDMVREGTDGGDGRAAVTP